MSTVTPQSPDPKAANWCRRGKTQLHFALFCFAGVYLAAAGAETYICHLLQ
jgi:hypothetical protein